MLRTIASSSATGRTSDVKSSATASPRNRRGKRAAVSVARAAPLLLAGTLLALLANFYAGVGLDAVSREDGRAVIRGGNDTRAAAGFGTVRQGEPPKTASMKEESSPSSGMIAPNLADGTLFGKERIWEMLRSRNVTEIDAAYWASVPTEEDVRRLHGADAPLVRGLETCERFRTLTKSDPTRRRIAPAGLFNTGTNYLSVLLEFNCQNPDRVAKFRGNAKRGHGNEWEPPWGKHTPPRFRGNYTKGGKRKGLLAYDAHEVLPAVLIRNPFDWMRSMCRNPYSANWAGRNDKRTCPMLKQPNGEWNPVDVSFGPGKTHHASLAHLWNDWYGEYFYKDGIGNGTVGATVGADRIDANESTSADEAPFPRLMIRFEDIIFYPREVTKQICECAGGVLGHRDDDKDVPDGEFHYVVRSAKAGFGHGPVEKRNGLVDAWVKYGNGKANPREEFDGGERSSASEALNPMLIRAFGYS